MTPGDAAAVAETDRLIDRLGEESKAAIRALLERADPAPLALAMTGYAELLQKIAVLHAAHTVITTKEDAR